MGKSIQLRSRLQCTLHPLNTLGQYKYVVICSWYNGQWLFSRHRNRSTWETQGGHIESGEPPLAAAARELYEESGVTHAQLLPICDYYGYDDQSHANGIVFLARIRTLGTLPQSEMAETALFSALPENLTYPHVTPKLCAAALELIQA